MRTRRRGRLAVWGVSSLIALTTALLAAAPGTAAPLRGELDRSFGNGGQVVTSLAPTFAPSAYTEVATQPDGSVVLAGQTERASGGHRRSADFVQRRTPSGALDPGFHEFITKRNVRGLAPQADGGVLVGLERVDGCRAEGAVERLAADGTPDTSYGNGGSTAQLPLAVSYLATDAEGRTLVAGYITGPLCHHDPVPTEYGPALARVLPNGAIDKSFGTDGLLMVADREGFQQVVHGITVMGDGTIVVVGEDTIYGVTPAGTLDSRFGKEGSIDFEGQARALLQTGDGKLVVAGVTGGGAYGGPRKGQRFRIRRYLADGAPDPEFGSGGAEDIAVGEVDVPTALAAGSEGSVLLAGETATTAPAEVCERDCDLAPYLVRLRGDGSVDPGFVAQLPAPVTPPSFMGVRIGRLATMAVGPGGRIVVAGSAGIVEQATVSALEPGGAPDSLFGSAGVASEPRPLPSVSEVAGLAAAGGGLVFSARSDSGVYGSRRLLFGRTADGAPNPAFITGLGEGGLPRGHGIDLRPEGLRTDAQGRLYEVDYGASGRRRLVRFDATGHPDSSYGTDGGAALPTGFIQPTQLNGTQFLVRPDGAALVIGRVDNSEAWAVFGLTPGGLPDPGFGHHGLARIGWGKKGRTDVLAATLDRRGRIVLFGAYEHTGALVRLLSNGRLDPSFARRGRQIDTANLFTGVTRLAVAPDGGIYLASSIQPGGFRSSGTAIVRFRADGVRDPSFARHGVLRLDHARPLVGLFAGRRGVVVITAADRHASRGVALHAYRADGRRDLAFGRGGEVFAAQGRAGFTPLAATRQSDGRIVVAGTRGLEGHDGATVELLRFR